MKRVAMAWLLFAPILVGGEVKLRLGDEITWKAFFDAGFRPHFVMDGKEFCRQYDVRVSISSEHSPNWLNMNPGTVLFDVGKDDLVLGFRIDTNQELSAKEAEARLQKFQKIFKKYIKPENSGSIEYSEKDNRYDYGRSSSRADMSSWRIRYSLTSSYQELQYPQPPLVAWKPFIERLSIVYRGDLQKFSDQREKPISPPAGYEWYSLDPKVSTPDPVTEDYGSGKIVPEITSLNSKPVKNPDPKDELLKDTPKEGIEVWVWILLLITGLSIAVRIWKKRLQAS